MTTTNYIDYSKIKNLQFMGVDRGDYPRYCDAYIVDGTYNGLPLTQDEIDMLNEDRAYVAEQVTAYIFQY